MVIAIQSGQSQLLARPRLFVAVVGGYSVFVWKERGKDAAGTLSSAPVTLSLLGCSDPKDLFHQESAAFCLDFWCKPFE